MISIGIHVAPIEGDLLDTPGGTHGEECGNEVDRAQRNLSMRKLLLQPSDRSPFRQDAPMAIVMLHRKMAATLRLDDEPLTHPRTSPGRRSSSICRLLNGNCCEYASVWEARSTLTSCRFSQHISSSVAWGKSVRDEHVTTDSYASLLQNANGASKLIDTPTFLIIADFVIVFLVIIGTDPGDILAFDFGRFWDICTYRRWVRRRFLLNTLDILLPIW